MPIRKVGPNKFKIDNVPGFSKSKAAALKRLRAIKASQHKRRHKK